MNAQPGFKKILVATDFSPSADAALQQAVWLAAASGATIDIVHVVPTGRNPTDPKMDLFFELWQEAGGDSIGRESASIQEITTKLQQAAKHAGRSVAVDTKILTGEAFVEIIRTVQHEPYEIVFAGTRGLSQWEQFKVGSTAKRLIRKCPASVWVVKAVHAGQPSVVLAATDFSDVSRKAVRQGLEVAQRANAAFYLLHVVDSKDVPEDAISHVPKGGTLQEEIVSSATSRMEQFIDSLAVNRKCIQVLLSWGVPWQEIRRAAKYQAADLVAIGTVGRNGLPGLLLGNTADKLLDTCDCSLLTVKPDGFQSPITV